MKPVFSMAGMAHRADFIVRLALWIEATEKQGFDVCAAHYMLDGLIADFGMMSRTSTIIVESIALLQQTKECAVWAGGRWDIDRAKIRRAR
jgi:hypothetical protein